MGLGTTIVYWGNIIGIMEKKIETTIACCNRRSDAYETQRNHIGLWEASSKPEKTYFD